METDAPLKQHKLEVAALLQTLADSMDDRLEKVPVTTLEDWAKMISEESLPPLIIDELMQICDGLARMSRHTDFTSTERAIVASIQNICGQYDEIVKLQ